MKKNIFLQRLMLFWNSRSEFTRYTGLYERQSISQFIDESFPVTNNVKLGSESVFQLTEESFNKHVANGYHFVKFYTPWCGHCKQLVPVWQQLAFTFSSVYPLTFAELDCTMDWIVCAKYNILSYPTLLLFVDGTKIDKYEGKRDVDSLTNYIKSMLKKFNMVSTEETNSGNVVELRELDIDSVIQPESVFILFYIQSCPYCKNLLPVWKNFAANQITGEDIQLAQVNCELNREFCKKEDIRVFPTLVYFHNNKQVDRYGGSLDIEALQQFTENVRNIQLQSNSNDIEIANVQSHVVTLGQFNFSHVTQFGYTFVNYYKQWCEHCQRLAPVWSELSEKFDKQYSIVIATVDCVFESQLCIDEEIKGYPSLILYKNNIKVDQYTGPHELDHIYSYLLSMIGHDEL